MHGLQGASELEIKGAIVVNTTYCLSACVCMCMCVRVHVFAHLIFGMRNEVRQTGSGIHTFTNIPRV